MLASALITLAAYGALQATIAPPRAYPSGPAEPAQTTPTAPPSDTAWTLGTLEIGALSGWGKGTVFDPARTPTSIAQVIGRVAVHLGPTGTGWLRGNVSFAVEGVGAWIDQDPSASGAGLNLLFRYTWDADRWRPMFLGGAGVLYTDEQVPPGETTRNFSPQAGLGLQYLIRAHIAIGGEYRFHHLSNKGATKTNPGINTHLILFGVSWYR